MNILFTLMLSAIVFAQNFSNSATDVSTANIKNPLVVASVSSAPEDLTPGKRFPILLTLTLPEGFHAYEDKFKIHVLAPEGMEVSEPLLKAPQDFTDFSGKTHKGLNSKGELEIFLEWPKNVDSSLEQIKMELEYIACTKKYCLPRNKVEFSVPVHSTAKAAPSDSSTTSYIEQKLQENIFLAFLIIFAFGFLTSLTPCVYPLIPITLAVIGARASQSKKSQAFLLSVVYVLGIAMTYSILGVVAAQTGALFGQALSYPPVVIFFACLFFLMGLSLFGLFEIRAPHFITQRLSQSQSSGKGYIGAFVSGLVAGVIASPCVGPVLVGILAYIAKTQDVVLGFWMLFTFAMGLGVLFIVIGTSSSLLKKIPRSGGWMNGIKYAMGVCMILLGLYYLRPLLNERPSDTATASVPLKNGWRLYSEDLMAEAKKNGQPVMIDFYADWCGACVELDTDAFSKEIFIKASKDFMLLKVDATENYPELSELQQKYDVYGLPTVAFVSKSGQLIKDLTLTGFEEADKIVERMQKAKAAP